MKSFSKLFTIYRIRLAYLIIMASIIATMMFAIIVLMVFLGDESYRVSLYFMPIVVILTCSFFTIYIMGTTCFIIVGSYICEKKEEKKKIKKYAFLKFCQETFFFLLYMFVISYLAFVKNAMPTPIFLAVLCSMSCINIALILSSEKLEKLGMEVTKVYKKGFIYQDYVIAFDFISGIDYIFNPDNSKKAILKVFLNDKKSIKFHIKPNLHDLKEVYPNVRLFNIKENRYIEETNPNK